MQLTLIRRFVHILAQTQKPTHPDRVLTVQPFPSSRSAKNGRAIKCGLTNQIIIISTYIIQQTKEDILSAGDFSYKK